MLISLSMKNWRKHTDKVINFTSGLNAVRGANENGKTSMLLAIAYALWGTKVLPLTFSEMVTWGMPESSAKVGLVMSKDGEMYSFTRSKNGAECNHSGGVVTGQNEVSAFATELIGADAKLAMKLMFAPQGELRSALQGGPSAVTSYIEEMSGMDLFETLIDLIGEKLTTGPTKNLDTEISTIEVQIDAGAPEAPSFDKYDADIQEATARLADLERVLPQIEQDQRIATDLYAEAKAADSQRQSSLNNLLRARDQHSTRLVQRDEDLKHSQLDIDEARVTELQRNVDDAKVHAARVAAHSAFKSLTMPEVVWDEPETSLKAAITAQKARVKLLETSHRENNLDMTKLQAGRVTSSICGFCQQDLSQFPEVAKKNADIDEKISILTASQNVLVQELATVEAELADLEAVLASAGPFNAFLMKHSQYVAVNEGTVPPTLTWIGDVPEADMTPSVWEAKLKSAKVALAQKNAAVTRLEQVERDLEQDRQTIASLEAAVPAPVDLGSLLTVKAERDQAVVTQREQIAEKRNYLQSKESSKARVLADYRLACRAYDALKVGLVKKRAERDTLLFNNNLLKKVKAARPKVAAKLWGLVLNTVSTMFTSMRGEHSVVTKGPNGFLVNERPAEALSGSALDLLGFSIRVAMLKTFIPDCSFMILDEATSACDDERTASLLGFIASAGFPQTLLVTHEIASESVADNVVMI
jgi:DNA repair exonuclease SbcCD ATPase subunit